MPVYLFSLWFMLTVPSFWVCKWRCLNWMDWYIVISCIRLWLWLQWTPLGQHWLNTRHIIYCSRYACATSICNTHAQKSWRQWYTTVDLTSCEVRAVYTRGGYLTCLSNSNISTCHRVTHRRCTTTTNRLEETRWTTKNHLAENNNEDVYRPTPGLWGPDGMEEGKR